MARSHSLILSLEIGGGEASGSESEREDERVGAGHGATCRSCEGAIFLIRRQERE
jgi:hypothetical protein